jgi:Cu-processing system ATP-binding protein
MKRIGLRDVTVRFRRVEALSSASVALEAGQVLMLAGPNGAGKTTLMRVLLGLVRPQGGAVVVDGRPHAVDRRFKARLSYLPEAVAFQEGLSGRQVLRFFAWARGVPGKRIDGVLERVGLTYAARRRVGEYSRGMRQRLGLAAAILAEPDLLVLDEPTGGLDQEGLKALWTVLAEWRDAGRMVLLSAHDLALLESRVDRVCILRAGRVLADAPPHELRRAAALPQRVRMDLAATANGAADALLNAMRRHGTATLDRPRGQLDVEVAPDGLLSVLEAHHAFPGTVTGMRVEEPALDRIYERLLEED